MVILKRRKLRMLYQLKILRWFALKKAEVQGLIMVDQEVEDKKVDKVDMERVDLFISEKALESPTAE